MSHLLAAALLLATLLTVAPAQAVTRNAVYVESDSTSGVPVQCANHRWHYLRPGHRSKCVRTISFHARYRAPHTSYYDDAGNWTTLRGGVYSTSSRILLRNGWTA